MKILYGLSGEGFGHSSRARTIIPYLTGKGHEVTAMTYGSGARALKDRFDVFEIEGPEIVYERGRLRKKKTVARTIANMLANLSKSRDMHSLMRKKDFDLCISDMEPVVPILANARWYDIPLLCLDNQHRLTHLELEIPRKYRKDFIRAREVTRAIVRKADWFIITSFGISRIRKKHEHNTVVVPPIIRPQVKRLQPEPGDDVIVYTTKRDKRLPAMLKDIEERFLVYGWDVDRTEENLTFRPAGDGLLEDLRKAKAVIATAGYTLISESLYLKKPYFALPMAGQFEQTLNALFLKHSGLGDYSDEPDKESVKGFLTTLADYEAKLRSYDPDYDAIFPALDNVVAEARRRS